MQVGNTNSKGKTTTVENLSMVQEFVSVLWEEIPGLIPKWDRDFIFNFGSFFGV